MKKAFFAFTAALLLLLAVSLAAAVSLHGQRDNVTVSAEVLSGDLSAAEGLTASQTVHYGFHLLWDLSIPLDSPESTIADFSHHYQYLENHGGYDAYYSDPYFEIRPLGSTGVHIMVSGGTSSLDQIIADDPRYTIIADAIYQVADMTPAGEQHAETVKLADYTDVYPLSLYTSNFHPLDGIYFPDDPHAADRFLTDYFSFPTPADAEITVSVGKDETGEVNEFFALNPKEDLDPTVHYAHQGEDFFFTFAPNRGLDFSNTSGGFGIYRLDAAQPEGRSDIWYLDMDALENVCPLPNGAAVLALALSPDGATLFVPYYFAEEYTLLALDTATLSVLSAAPIPAPPPGEKMVTAYDYFGEVYSYTAPDWPMDRVIAGDNFAVLVGDLNPEFYFFPRTAEGYALAYTAPAPEHLQHLPYDNQTGLWDGERLALASVWREHDNTTGLTLSVFQDGAMTLLADYSTSLDGISRAEGGEQAPMQNELDLLKGHELALTD